MGAQLRKADLTGAACGGASFDGADLAAAMLHSAFLEGASFRKYCSSFTWPFRPLHSFCPSSYSLRSVSLLLPQLSLTPSPCPTDARSRLTASRARLRSAAS